VAITAEFASKVFELLYLLNRILRSIMFKGMRSSGTLPTSMILDFSLLIVRPHLVSAVLIQRFQALLQFGGTATYEADVISIHQYPHYLFLVKLVLAVQVALSGVDNADPKLPKLGKDQWCVS
jgi:hypothetical protein